MPNYYDIIHRLPYETSPTGSIFVIDAELGPPFDTHAERQERFQRRIAEVNKGDIIERPARSTVIVPKTELTIVTILDRIREYHRIENVRGVTSSYRNWE